MTGISVPATAERDTTESLERLGTTTQERCSFKAVGHILYIYIYINQEKLKY